MAKVGVAAGWPIRRLPARASIRGDVSARAMPARSDPPRGRDGGSAWLLAVVVGAALLAWAAINLGVERARFAVVSPETQAGVEAASALARFFGALVLLFVPDPTAGRRLRWVAAGLLVLGLGGLGFGYLPPLVGLELELNTRMYASLAVWTCAGVLFVLGLLPVGPPRVSPRAALVVLVGTAVLVALAVDRLPVLVRLGSPEAAVESGHPILPGLTGWHWGLSAVPLGLAVAATVGAARLAAEGLGQWLVVAMALLAGSQVHNLFWPSAYGPVLTTANLLRLGFAAAVVVGGIVTLRGIAAERAVLLAAEREASKRLADLAVIRADFSAMVAHELGSPIAAVRRSADLLATEDLTPLQASAVATIRSEAQVLANLLADVQTMAGVERDDFAVSPFPVPLSLLLAEAVRSAKALPGDHPVVCEFTRRERVLADPERIHQVLRNLLSNAAKYSPPGSPIEVRAERRGQRVRVEVVDRGYGIHPEDLTRVFEKFGRGRDAEGRGISGVGLGLYLTRRIVQAHGSDLTVESEPGRGSTFAFELEVVR